MALEQARKDDPKPIFIAFFHGVFGASRCNISIPGLGFSVDFDRQGRGRRARDGSGAGQKNDPSLSLFNFIVFLVHPDAIHPSMAQVFPLI